MGGTYKGFHVVPFMDATKNASNGMDRDIINGPFIHSIKMFFRTQLKVGTLGDGQRNIVHGEMRLLG